MSPDLFNLYSEIILRNIEKEKGIQVGGHNVTNIRYADDTVLLAESAEGLQKLLDIVVRESKIMGLNINYKKTECLVVAKRGSPKCDLKLGDKDIKQVSSFNYLGSIITEDARCEKEIKRRIALAKSAFSKLSKLLRNRSLSIRTRMRVLYCYVHPVLMYGSEAWTITTDMKKRLASCEMWFIRQMMKIKWTDRVSNEEVLRRATVNQKLLSEIRIRQMRFMGHLVRKGGLENLSLTGKIEGKRSRGRRRVLWMDSLMKWLEERGVEEQGVQLVEKARNRELWNNMIAKVDRYGT